MISIINQMNVFCVGRKRRWWNEFCN